MEKSIQKPESVQDQPVFHVYNVNSNFPEKVSSYPAIHISRHEMGEVVWCRVNGVPTGVMR